MKASTIIVCTTILAATGLIAVAPSRTISRPVYAAAAPAPGISTRIDTTVQQAIREEHFSGGVLVRQASTVLIRKVYGKADAHQYIENTATTKFAVPGMTALFTTVALEQLAEHGKLARSLFHRESGDGSARLATSIRRIESASGESYAAYLQRHMFRPLGMTHTEVQQHAGAVPVVYTTLDDLDNWNQAVLGCMLVSPQALFTSMAADHLQMVPASTQQGAAAGDRISLVDGTTIIVLANQGTDVRHLLAAIQHVLYSSKARGARI